MSALRRVESKPADRPVVITGGAGFLGADLAHRLLSVAAGVEDPRTDFVSELHRSMAGEPAAPEALRPVAEGSIA